MIQLQWPVTFSKKRQTAGALGAPSEWIPTNNSFNFPQTESTRLATVGRCLRLYSDFANLCPLKVKGKKRPLLYFNVIETGPNSYMSRDKSFLKSIIYGSAFEWRHLGLSGYLGMNLGRIKNITSVQGRCKFIAYATGKW